MDINITSVVRGFFLKRSKIKLVAKLRKRARMRSEEHTSELQSHSDLVCRLLLEKKNKITI